MSSGWAVVLSTTAGATTQADASTWVFLGVLGGATAFVLAGWWRTAARWHPPEPRDDLLTPERFYARYGQTDEIDLGRGWRSLDDPGAIWHLWWCPTDGRVIGLRCPAHPPPGTLIGVYQGRGSWGGAYSGVVAATSGMKVLGHLPRPDLHAIAAVRRHPAGLDAVLGGTHPTRRAPA
jgi:hypothetical protein